MIKEELSYNFKDYVNIPKELIGRKVLYYWVNGWLYEGRGYTKKYEEVIESVLDNGFSFTISNHPNRSFEVKTGFETGMDFIGINKCILID